VAIASVAISMAWVITLTSWEIHPEYELIFFLI